MDEVSGALDSLDARAQARAAWVAHLATFGGGKATYYEYIDDYLELSSFLDPKGGQAEATSQAQVDSRVEYLRTEVLGLPTCNPSGQAATPAAATAGRHDAHEAADQPDRTKRLAYFCLQHHYRAGLDTDVMRTLMEECAGQGWFQMDEKLQADDFLLIEPHLWYFMDSDQAREAGQLDAEHARWLNNPAEVAKRVGDFVDKHPFPPLLHLYALTVADLWSASSTEEWAQALRYFDLLGSQRWLDLLRGLAEDGREFPKEAHGTAAPLLQALINVKLAITNWTVTDWAGQLAWWRETPDSKEAPVHPRYYATEARIRSLLGETIGRDPYNDERTAREQFRQAGVAIDRAIAGQRVSDSRGALLIAEFRGIRGEVQLRRTAFDIEVRSRRMIREAAERSQAEAMAAVENSKLAIKPKGRD